ncbi:MAG TPA: hypothetical protein VHS53_11375 [Mucilaginibacter sp.]|nr:hypothetical protein [Mucilaginibacter sp.]
MVAEQADALAVAAGLRVPVHDDGNTGDGGASDGDDFAGQPKH